MATEQYSKADQDGGGEVYGNPSTSQPYVVRDPNGSTTYFYDCMPEDFAGQLRWPWIVAALGGLLLLLPPLLTWLTVEILGPKTSFDGFGTLKGAVFSDLQPTNFNDQKFITEIARGDSTQFGLYPFNGWILVGLAVVGLAFAITGFFIKQKWASFVVAAAGGIALAWTIFQYINIAGRLGSLRNSLRQVIDTKTLDTSADVVLQGGLDFAPWLAMLFAGLVLIGGIFYAVRG